jgi:Bacterial Ig-like domain (group 3)
MTSGTGTCSVTATKAADSDYSSATSVAATVGASLATQSALTVTGVPATAQVYGATFTVGSAGGSGTGAVTYSGSGACSATGATITMTSGTGTCSVTATKAADSDYSSATSVAATVGASKAVTITTLSTSSTSITPGQSVTLTATVASATSGAPSGTVSFFDNGTLLNSAPATLNAGVASFAAASLAPGMTHVITATYSGDSNFLGSSAQAAASTNITVAPLDFTMALTGPASLTLAPGQSISYGIQVTPEYGAYAGTVNFTVSGLPPGASATVSPALIPADGGTQTVTVTITAAPATAQVHRETAPSGRKLEPIALGFLLLFGAGALRKRGRALRGLLCVLLLAGASAAAVMLSGCGTNSGLFAQAPQNYTVTVTATAGNIQHTSTITLNVQ